MESSEFLSDVAGATNESPLWQLLFHWRRLMQEYAERWNYKDVPWLYKERALVGFLAAAAWQAGGIALEEYAGQKAGRAGRAGKITPYTGRADLYFRVGKFDCICEAEWRRGLHGKLNSTEFREEVRKCLAVQLKEAETVIRCNESASEREIPIGIQFIGFDLHAGKESAKRQKTIIEDVTAWIKTVKTKREESTVVAWHFPLHRLESMHYEKSFCPGCAIFLKIGKNPKERSHSKWNAHLRGFR